MAKAPSSDFLSEIHLELSIPHLPPTSSHPPPSTHPPPPIFYPAPDPIPRLSYSMGISLIGEASPKKEIRNDFKGKIGILKGIKMKISSKFSKKHLIIEKFIITPSDLASSRNFDKLLRRLLLIDPSKVKHLIIQDLKHRFLIQLWKEIELRIRNWSKLESIKFYCTLLEK